jgi:hypothetical protein
VEGALSLVTASTDFSFNREVALHGGAFAVSTVLWTAAHGAAALLITARNFPFGSRRLYAEEVVATMLSGTQNRVIARI